MISYMKIERFKCFDDQSITFGNLTLFAGNNGTGKSTVIQVLLLLRQAFVLGRLKKNEVPLNGELIKIGTAKDALFAASEEDNLAFTLGFNEDSEESVKWTFYYRREAPDEHFMKGTSDSDGFPSLGPFTPRFFYLMAERLGPRLVYPISEAPRMQMDVGTQGEFTPHCLGEFGREPIANENLALETKEGDKNLSLENQTQLWMRKLVPGLAVHVEPISKADSVRLEVKVYRGETGYFRPTNMGFGICYTLPIIVAGLMAQRGEMLLIENPEAHLHPAGQSLIGQFLALVTSGGVQVVIETHSDHVLNGVRKSVKKKFIDHQDVEIQYFERGRELGSILVTTPALYEDGGIDTWPMGFFDQFEKDLEDLI